MHHCTTKKIQQDWQKDNVASRVTITTTACTRSHKGHQAPVFSLTKTAPKWPTLLITATKMCSKAVCACVCVYSLLRVLPAASPPAPATSGPPPSAAAASWAAPPLTGTAGLHTAARLLPCPIHKQKHTRRAHAHKNKHTHQRMRATKDKHNHRCAQKCDTDSHKCGQTQNGQTD